jgi:hypothetical protein
MFFNLKFKRGKYKNDFRSLYLYVKTFTKHKVFEFQIMKYSYYWFGIELNLNFSGQDHAGPFLEICILGYILNIGIYDNRHWDEINNCWIN